MLEIRQKVQNSTARLIFQCRKQNHISSLLISLHGLLINAGIEYKLSVICHSFFLGLSPIYSQCTHPKEIYALLVTIEFYVSLNCEERHFEIVHFLLQPPQHGILCLPNSDELNLSRNLSQHKKLIFLGNSIHYTLIKI